jgi:hypothetical protein
MYPCACGYVSTCTRLCIHMHVAINPSTRSYVSTFHVSTCMWGCIHMQNLIIRYSFIVQNFVCMYTAQNLVMCYGPHPRIMLRALCQGQRRILLSAINCSTESLATAPNQLKFIEKIATTFKGMVRPKNCIFTKFTTQGLCHSCLNLSQLWSNLILRFWPLRRVRFELKNFCEFEVEFKTVFGHKSVYQVGSIWEKNQRPKILWLFL